MFLDELPEFDRKVLDVLREPLETGCITISRANRQADFPARFQLVAAMNPCPCGYLGDASGRCHCTAEQVARYRARISGPLLDRIDLHVEVPNVTFGDLAGAGTGEASAPIRARVMAARQLQQRRFARRPRVTCNARMTSRDLKKHCALDEATLELLKHAMTDTGLSARAYDRVLKVCGTRIFKRQSIAVSKRSLNSVVGLVPQLSRKASGRIWKASQKDSCASQDTMRFIFPQLQPTHQEDGEFCVWYE